MKNIEEVRKALCVAFKDIRSGKMDVKQASGMANMAGKIIGTLKVELEYASLRNEEPDIEFLSTRKKKKINR